LNALAKNWRQKATSSPIGDAPRRPAGAESDAEVNVAMTRPLFFVRGLCRGERLFPALKTSFGLIY
jgi:hypothetical protein